MRKNAKKIDAVLNAVRSGCSLYASCVKAGLSTKGFYDILAVDEEARVLYQLALSDYADQCTDEIRGIAENLKAGEMDNSTAKLLIETTKWLAQKACPEPFRGIDESGGEGGDEVAEILVKFV